MLRIPEIEFIERVMSSSKISSKGAKMFYDKLWKLFIDLRTADRKRKKKDRFVLNPDQTYGIETQVRKAAKHLFLMAEPLRPCTPLLELNGPRNFFCFCFFISK